MDAEKERVEQLAKEHFSDLLKVEVLHRDDYIQLAISYEGRYFLTERFALNTLELFRDKHFYITFERMAADLGRMMFIKDDNNGTD